MVVRSLVVSLPFLCICHNFSSLTTEVLVFIVCGTNHMNLLRSACYRPQRICEGYIFTGVCLSTGGCAWSWRNGSGGLCLVLGGAWSQWGAWSGGVLGPGGVHCPGGVHGPRGCAWSWEGWYPSMH